MEAFGDEDWAKAARGSNVANAVVGWFVFSWIDLVKAH